MRRVRIPSDAFDATKVALKAIQASTDACLPLKSGVSVALVLLEMSERIKSNKGECDHLAERTAQIMQDIWRQTKDFNVELSAEVERSVAEIETRQADMCLLGRWVSAEPAKFISRRRQRFLLFIYIPVALIWLIIVICVLAIRK
ncbi:hypothetical protein C8R45DRAFT_1218373 [Mycena sanguinolenta]|nr:hypothetical protein C8R45DRAFT_1218373 [Mycena sanguinolenta]